MSEDQVAWTAMPYRAPVLDSTGAPIGSAESLLGDESEDIFHGVVVKRTRDGALVEVPQGLVSRITATHVYTTISPGDVGNLQPYREERWYHLGWGGLFVKHPEWTRYNPS
ncbi:MAG: hypothetical protein ACREQ5_22625 [Candidatus Dormibacteria bacterium]